MVRALLPSLKSQTNQTFYEGWSIMLQMQYGLSLQWIPGSASIIMSKARCGHRLTFSIIHIFLIQMEFYTAVSMETANIQARIKLNIKGGYIYDQICQLYIVLMKKDHWP
jgi:hypothetical protein